MINGGLRIHVSASLGEVAPRTPMEHAFGTPPLLDRLHVPGSGQPPRHRYFDWHRERVWRVA